MHHADKTITIFNAVYDADAGYDTYKRTVLAGVSWFSRTQTTVSSDGGLLAADEFTVRVPGELCAGYVEPALYDGTEGTWTLQAGDTIVKAEVPAGTTRPADLKKTYRDIMTVTGVTDNRCSRGAHIKAVGK